MLLQLDDDRLYQDEEGVTADEVCTSGDHSWAE